MKEITMIFGAFGQDGVLLTRALSKSNEKLLLVGRDRHICFFQGSKCKCVITGGECQEEPVDISILDQIVGKKVFVEKFYYLAAFHKPRNLRLTEEENKDSIFYVNYTLFKKLCCLLIEKAKVKKIFYAGSSRIFEGSKCKVAAESASSMPRSFYGEAKSLSREFCRELNMKHGVPTFNGILFNHDSYLRQEGFLIPRLMTAALDAARIPGKYLVMDSFCGGYDGSLARDFTKWMMELMSSNAPGGDYIFSSGLEVRILPMIEQISSELSLSCDEWVRASSKEVDRRHTTILGDPSRLASYVQHRELTLDVYVSSLIDEYRASSAPHQI